MKAGTPNRREVFSDAIPGRDALAWDRFLSECARGQFQQSSGWAAVKALDGWSAVREYLDPADPASGGFQLLWKRSRVGRIGYVSKGPVLPDETEQAVQAALERVADAARGARLAAIVLQPPDDSAISSGRLARGGYVAEPLQNVIRATGVISLDGGADGALGRMSRTARQDWRTARRQGLNLRSGSRQDLGIFFSLMCESCRRQRAAPNPSRLELLEALWDAFPGKVGLSFVEHEGRSRAGLLTIHQRGTIVFWKKGWDAETPRLFASTFLMVECLIQAAALGFSEADMVSLSPDTAAAILAGAQLSETQRRSRDMFNLRFGAKPKLLPPAHLLVLNPALRRATNLVLRWPTLRQALERRVA